MQSLKLTEWVVQPTFWSYNFCLLLVPIIILIFFLADSKLFFSSAKPGKEYHCSVNPDKQLNKFYNKLLKENGIDSQLRQDLYVYGKKIRRETL